RGLLRRVHDVGRHLQTFVVGRIVEQALELLEHWQYSLAGSRGITTHHRGDFVLLHQLTCFLRERRPVAGAVLDDGFDFLPHHTATFVDFVYRQHFGIDDGLLRDGDGTGQRMQDADLDCVGGLCALRPYERRGYRAGGCSDRGSLQEIPPVELAHVTPFPCSTVMPSG